MFPGIYDAGDAISYPVASLLNRFAPDLANGQSPVVLTDSKIQSFRIVIKISKWEDLNCAKYK